MKLLEPIQVGPLTLKNRIMFPPLSTGYEEKDGSIGEQSRAFYTRLAKGGVGYIVLGDVSPVPTVSPTPKLYQDSQIPSFARLADSLHEHGAKLGIQIFHPEYDSAMVAQLVGETFALLGKSKALLAQGKEEEAKAIQAEGEAKRKEAFAFLHHSMMHFANSADKAALEQIKEAMVQTAIRAQKAGVDAIEIHGDRIVGSLCSIRLNRRNDEYGGSFENRIRYALEVTKAIIAAVPGMMIEYKLPVITLDKEGAPVGKGGLFLEEAVELARRLQELGVHAIHVGQANHTGNNNDTIPSMGSRDYAFMLQATKKVKEAVNIPVSAVGRIISSQNGEMLLQSGVADIIAYGRSLLCDPDIPVKLASGEPIRECMSCNKGCTDAIAGKGTFRFVSCVLNPENGFEATKSIIKTAHPKKVGIVGGGIAGLEAARVAALKGHHVDLFESTYSLGGQIRIASVPPRKEEMVRSIAYYEKILPRLGVRIHMGHAFNKEDAKGFDHLILATGAKPLVPNIPGIRGINVASAWDVLSGKALPFGGVLVLGGGLVGAETAEYLACKGLSVGIVEMTPNVAAQESPTILPIMMKDFADHGVDLYTSCKVKEIREKDVLVDVLDAQKNPVEEKSLPCDFVVNALASVKNPIDLSGLDIPVSLCGDVAGDAPSNIDHALLTAYDCANAIE
ncbi:MAG: FAD-dependent oxidoreductase [Candidatus Enteromonas sp.]|nr:FAD-dependent oxidoreductase [Candidatus Enteromonas sp.]